MFRQIAQPSTICSACSSLSVVAMATSTRAARRVETGEKQNEKSFDHWKKEIRSGFSVHWHIHTDWRIFTLTVSARYRLAPARNERHTPILGAVAVAAVPIVKAMAIAISRNHRAGGAKLPARERNAPRKSIAEPIKARSNSLMDRSISISMRLVPRG